MRDTFIDRNKRKSAWALLLLFLRQNKTLSALLLLVVVSSMLFLGSSASLIDLPGGPRLLASVAWIAQRFGADVSQWGLAGGHHSYQELLAAFRAAKSAGRGAVPYLAGNERAPKDSGPGSLGFVKGTRKDLVGSDSGNGVRGVIGAEEGKAGADASGVEIANGDLKGEREGFVKSAFAGGFMRGIFGGGADGANALSGGAYAGRGFFGGGTGSAASRPGDSALSAIDGVGSVGVPSSRIKGGVNGRLSMSRAKAMEARAMYGASRAGSGGRRAFVQLAEGRGQAKLATAPNCAPPGCPGEYSTSHTGAIYDGNRVSGAGTDILMASKIDGAGTPDIPGSGLADGYMKEAAQMEKDAETCRQLDDKYGPTETALNQEMQDISDQFRALNCGSGGCSKKKMKKCKALGDKLKAVCNSYMSVRCRHTHECPLTKGQNCSNECTQSGNGVNKNKVIDYNNGVRTETKD